MGFLSPFTSLKIVHFSTALSIALAILPMSLGQAQTKTDLRAEITEARIGSDRRPIVTVRISDSNGLALGLADLDAGSGTQRLAVAGKEGHPPVRPTAGQCRRKRPGIYASGVCGRCCTRELAPVDPRRPGR